MRDMLLRSCIYEKTLDTRLVFADWLIENGEENLGGLIQSIEHVTDDSARVDLERQPQFPIHVYFDVSLEILSRFNVGTNDYRIDQFCRLLTNTLGLVGMTRTIAAEYQQIRQYWQSINASYYKQLTAEPYHHALYGTSFVCQYFFEEGYNAFIDANGNESSIGYKRVINLQRMPLVVKSLDLFDTFSPDPFLYIYRRWAELSAFNNNRLWTTPLTQGTS